MPGWNQDLKPRFLRLLVRIHEVNAVAAKCFGGVKEV